MKVAFVLSSRSDFGLIRPVVKFFASVAEQQIDILCLDATNSLSENYLLDGISRAGVRVHRPLGTNAQLNHLATSQDTLSRFSEICSAVSHWTMPIAHELDWLIAPGDRFEIFAATIAAYYSNVPIAHLFGGDRSQGGHLDDSVRHCVSKLSHIHFPVCSDSATRLLNLGEESWRVINVGSPVVESALEIMAEDKIDISRWIPGRKYNLICTYHPITTEPERAGDQFKSVVDAILQVAEQEDISCIFTHPNNEVGSKAILAELARVGQFPNLRVYPSLGWQDYLRILRRCDLVIGNSSSAMLEAPIVGVPALDVGTRQKGRYCPSGVYREEEYDPKAIAKKILGILRSKSDTPIDHPYGDGSTSRPYL